MGSRCEDISMRTSVVALPLLALVCLGPLPAGAQFGFINNLFRPIMNFFRPITSGVRSVFFGPSTINSLRSEGRDELFPSDCGRDEKNMGKLCFGDPELCRARTGMSGLHQFNGRNYWFSWQDSSARVRGTKYDWVKGFVDGNVPYFWTSGRKCNFDGCDKPEFF